MSVKGPIVEEENPNIILTCSVDDPGRYNAKFLWIKDNVEQVGGSNGTFIIRQRSATVSKYDGLWICITTNNEDGHGANMSITVNGK